MFLEIVVSQECLKTQDCWLRDRAELLGQKQSGQDYRNNELHALRSGSLEEAPEQAMQSLAFQLI